MPLDWQPGAGYLFHGDIPISLIKSIGYRPNRADKLRENTASFTAPGAFVARKYLILANPNRFRPQKGVLLKATVSNFR